MRPHLLITLLCLLSLSAWATESTLDLRGENWSEGSVHIIQHDWAFYWHQLLKSDERESDLSQAILFPVPGAWSAPPKGYPSFPGVGFASYRTTLLVPENQSELFLAVPDMASAYKLWSNGKLVAANGIVGETKETESPGYLPRIARISPEAGKIELILETSNFHYQWGGVWYPMKLTHADGLTEIKEKPIIKGMLAATILLAACCFGMFMFFKRPKEKVLLYFSLLCFVMGLRRLLIDERILYYFVGEHWTTLQALENLSIYLAFPFFISYFSHRFPVKFSRHAIQISWIIALPFCSLAITSDVSFYTQFNVPFQIAILIAVPYIFYIYLMCLREGRRGAKTFGFGLAIFILTVVNDILAYSYVINTPNMAHLGILAFVIFQGIDLANSYLHNFSTIEKMSASLQAKNQELLKIDAFKDEFLATTSHELRTPLHGISGLANHLLQDDSIKLNLQNQHKLNLIASTTRRLGSLVNDIVDFSSIKHGNLTLEQKSVDLSSLSNAIINTLAPLVEGRDIRLSSEIKADAQFVMADENRLQQILFNLLGNAIKFTESGFIQLNATKSPDTDTVNIDIIDTGVGIAADKYDLLFEPFQHFGNASDSLYSGAGLGLSISRQLVRLHGGELVIHSKQGEGTQVQFSLSAAAPPETANTVPPTNPIHQTLTLGNLDNLRHATPPIRQSSWSPSNETQSTAAQTMPSLTGSVTDALIYAVDDEEVNLELVHSQLLAASYRVQCFISGIELLNALENQTPDLILLDLMMPTLSGLEVCREIRQDHDSYELPIMMVTARYQVNDIVDCLSSGANDYLIKPYHEQELLARVYSQLSARQFWFSHRENQVLKKEIDHRKQLEAELSVANSRLVHALDITDESIILLNQQFDMIYANQAAVARVSTPTDSIIGSPLATVVSEKTLNALRQHSLNATQTFSFSTDDAKLGDAVRLTMHPFKEKGENYFALILSAKQSLTEEQPANAPIPSELLQTLTTELTISREKFDQIEQTLKQISSSQARSLINKPEASADSQKQYRRELLIKLLRETINIWERYTHKTKADLAEESRCWRVYLDGTTAKTRTLDRYLSERTLPNKPRWQLVNRTAKYVLDHCVLNAQDSERLIDMMSALDNAYD